jgi:hypothetical protein
VHPKRCVQKIFLQPKRKGCLELLCGGGFITNPLCDVCFGSPPEFPFPKKALLAALGSAKTCNPGTIMLDTIDLKPHLPYHIDFQIVVAYTMKNFTRNIFCTVVDEGASTCMMSLVCWKAIGQPVFSPSPTLFTAFDGRSF